ncbi:MAG: RAMP superfamily CRISPR-associated protein [Candidatus Paceibacterota bacterium]
MLRRTICQTDVVVELEPVDPILIKSGYATTDGPDMVPVVTFRDGTQTYYFPGSSLKGVLRSQLERIARTLVPGSVCIPYFDPRRDIPVPVASEQQAHGCGFRASTDNDSSSVAYSDSCAACRMFGSLKFGSRFSIGDAYPVENHRPVPEQRNGVGIDRFTGGTVRGVLFDLQALVGGRFRANIRLVNFELWQLAALNILLFDLADELIAIGSGRSRGLGRVRGTVIEYKLSYVQFTEQVAGIYQFATEEERAAYGLHDWAPSAQIRLSNAQRRGLRTQFDLTGNWQQALEPLTPGFEAFLKWHGGPKGEASQRSREEVTS